MQPSSVSGRPLDLEDPPQFDQVRESLTAALRAKKRRPRFEGEVMSAFIMAGLLLILRLPADSLETVGEYVPIAEPLPAVSLQVAGAAPLPGRAAPDRSWFDVGDALAMLAGAAAAAADPARHESMNSLPAAYLVQVAAPDNQSDAELIVRRLHERGYDAFVQIPADIKPAIFRVRVGTFKTLADAETVASRLRLEEHVTPWVVRTTVGPPE